MSFKGKYAIVTGTASGIGKAIATKLSIENAIVFGLDIKKEKDDRWINFKCDVSNEHEVSSVFSEIKKHTNKIDYLVNAAGVLNVGKRTRILDQDIDDWKRLLDINLTSVLLMMKSTHGLLVNSECPSIVNISSEQAFKGTKNSTPYIVSKCGVNALTKTAALEFIMDNIRVNCVALGTVRTNILESITDNKEIIDKAYSDANAKLPFGIFEPNDVVPLVMFLLSPKSRMITGEIVLADGGRILI